jgi:tRNA(fMet)-specific endonuclease VapC
MNGKKYLLDTNAVIDLLKGNRALNSKLKEAEWIGISIITKIEFLSFKNLKKEDINLFINFLKKLDIVDISSENQKLINKIIYIRKKYKIKLPDAVIISSALVNKADLITNDLLIDKIDGLKIIRF